MAAKVDSATEETQQVAMLKHLLSSARQERDELRAALKLISRYAEEQKLLIPLHEQRQITEALRG